MGGGLGGGSSDAASTLLALNQLWGLGWSRDRLMALGLQLGADVPVFLKGQAAWAEGVGEVLQPVEVAEAGQKRNQKQLIILFYCFVSCFILRFLII